MAQPVCYQGMENETDKTFLNDGYVKCYMILTMNLKRPLLIMTSVGGYY
jgi:hypothetical protein